MDSLTHIVVGAAVGDLMLGKKIGNRAMIWGAIAGSVPDADVFYHAFTDDLGALTVHRGLTHSWFFMVTASFLLAWLVQAWYTLSWRNWPGYPWLRAAVFLVLYLLTVVAITGITAFLSGWGALVPGILGLIFGVFAGQKFYRNQIAGFAVHAQEPVAIDYKWWYLLFGIEMTLHIVLDCATTYGTQIWLPFSNHRVAWGNMAVVDLVFTTPIAIAAGVAATLKRGGRPRRLILVLGLALGSIYWVATLFNKMKVDAIWRKTLSEAHLQVDRAYVAPTLLNNLVWHGVAVSGDRIYVGDYALTDHTPAFRITGNYPYWLVPPPDLAGTRAWHILTWFSKGYYRWEKEGDGNYAFTDLRFGGIPVAGGEEDGVFKFHLVTDADGDWQVDGGREGSERDMREGLRMLWERMKGI